MPLPKNNLFFGYASKLTNEQKDYVDSIIDNQLTIVNARAGTGKTTLAVMAARFLERELVYIFSPVEEKTLGYTPGTVEEKEAKYIVPLKDALMEINEDPERSLVYEDNVDNVKNGNAWVQAMSHTFARGTNIKGKKVVIIDESQNFTRGELKKVLTRVHDDCKIVMIGHDGQIDLKDSSKSGFIPYLEHFKGEDYAKVCDLTINFRGRLAKHADELTW